MLFFEVSLLFESVNGILCPEFLVPIVIIGIVELFFYLYPVMPDFAEVYSFLGSVFDPTVHGHRERMDEMAPIDRETVRYLNDSIP
jgi:hypothetical protein